MQGGEGENCVCVKEFVCIWERESVRVRARVRMSQTCWRSAKRDPRSCSLPSVGTSLGFVYTG